MKKLKDKNTCKQLIHKNINKMVLLCIFVFYQMNGLNLIHFFIQASEAI